MDSKSQAEASSYNSARQALAKALVVVPTYNEIDNFPCLVEAIFAQGNLHILIVDDNSPDGTGELAEHLKDRYPGRLDVLHRPGKLGLGTAYVAGFRYALARGYAFVIQMDSDFSHDPQVLPQILAAAEHGDVVIGSRYITGGATLGWPITRRIISYGGSMYTRLVLGIGVNDATSGFVCSRSEVLVALDLDALRCTGFGFNVEFKWRCWQKGFRIIEVPITFTERQLGQSKMSASIFFEALTIVWRLRLESRRADK